MTINNNGNYSKSKKVSALHGGNYRKAKKVFAPPPEDKSVNMVAHDRFFLTENELNRLAHCDFGGKLILAMLGNRLTITLGDDLDGDVFIKELLEWLKENATGYYTLSTESKYSEWGDGRDAYIASFQNEVDMIHFKLRFAT